MSDASQGPGWWQASDGKWYPPEAATSAPTPEPTYAAPTPAPGPTYAAPTPTPGPVFTPSGPGPDPGQAIDAKGVVSSLYDFKFDHFVTPKLIRFFYAFFVILLTIGAVVFLLASLASGESDAIIVGLIVIPIGYFVYLIITRIYFELVAALFRIADDLRAIRKSKGV